MKKLSFKEQIELIESGAAYEEASGVFGLDVTEEEASLVLVPVSWDATASYQLGTAKAPAAILEASEQIDHFDLAFDRPYAKGICFLEEKARIKKLNQEAHALKGSPLSKEELIERMNSLSEELNSIVEKETESKLSEGKVVGLIGGEHSCPYGFIKALSKKHKEFGILHVDAHFDLRRAYEGYKHSHASIMYNTLTDFPEAQKIVSFGIRDFCKAEYDFSQKLIQEGKSLVYFDRDLYRSKLEPEGFKEVVKEAISFLPEKVYISFDIDGLETQFCPSTGTPVPGGLHYNDACYLIEELAASGKEIIGFDLCEVAPDKTGMQWDENVAMRLLYKLCGSALQNKK